MSLFEAAAVKAVRRALAGAGSVAPVVKLPRSARAAEERAAVLDAPLGSIVHSRVFMVDERPVLALIAGDRHYAAEALPRTLNLTGAVRPAEADETRRATGFPAGGVAPLALAERLPVVLDASLKRFATLYVAAGDARHVFVTTPEELKRLSGGIVSYAVTEGEPYHPAARTQRPFDRVGGLL